MTMARKLWYRRSMRTPLIIVVVLALSALTSRLALAAPDVLVPCKKLLVKVDKIDPMSGTVKFVCKAPKGVSFALPQFTSSPVDGSFGTGLQIRDLGSNLYIAAWVLTQGGWSGMGNPAGSKGFRYRNHSAGAPCRVVVVTTKRITGNCRANIGPGTLPVVGDVAIRLHFAGDAADSRDYCAQLGGTGVRNDAAALLRKDSPAPAICPPVS